MVMGPEPTRISYVDVLKYVGIKETWAYESFALSNLLLIIGVVVLAAYLWAQACDALN